MDEIFGLTVEEFLTPLFIPDGDYLFRQVHLNFLDRESKRFPNASHFKLKEGEKDLSVHWKAHISIEEVFYIIGISYNVKGKFKEINTFKVFQFPVSFLRELENIKEVTHSPVFNGNPAPIGMPNNYAHSSIYYDDDEEVRKKLSNFCNEKYDDSFCTVDIQSLEKHVSGLREKLNKTKYHCCITNQENLEIQ